MERSTADSSLNGATQTRLEISFAAHPNAYQTHARGAGVNPGADEPENTMERNGVAGVSTSPWRGR